MHNLLGAAWRLCGFAAFLKTESSNERVHLSCDCLPGHATIGIEANANALELAIVKATYR